MRNILKGIVVFFLFLFVSICLSAQRIDTAWTKIYGDSVEGYSVQQTTDGGYIIAGQAWSLGADGRDVYLIKTDSLGDSLWTRTYGGSYGQSGSSVQQTTDGGYIITGETWSNDTTSNVYLIKTDSLGDTLWTKTYERGDRDHGSEVQQTTDGGYIIIGVTCFVHLGSDDAYLIKTDSLGDTLWTRTYGGSENDRGSSVQQTTDRGYIVAGRTESYGAGFSDVYLIKTDSLGDTLWTRAYGGSYGQSGSSVQQTDDGGYIVAGGSGYNTDNMYLIKTNSIGDSLWAKIYWGNIYNYGYEVQQTDDGGYIITGFIQTSVGRDVYLIKTDSLGDTLWTRTYGGSKWHIGYSVQQTTDRGYIITGVYDRKVYLIKIELFPDIKVTSPNGGEKWQSDSTYDITWTSYKTSGGVKIEYSLNNGLDWTEIIASTPDDSSYPWTIPDTMSYNCLVRISDTNGTISDISNSVFTIYSDPFIIVTSPDGGETWYNEDNHYINWASGGTSGGVKIEYSINNGKDWMEVIASTPDSGIYLWNPPDTVSDSCLVSISDTNGSISDTSDAVFSIIPGSGVPIGSLEVYSINVKAIVTGSEVNFTYTLPEKASSVRFTLYNVAGLKIKEENLKESPAGYYSGNINMSGISKGIYFIRMEVNEGKFTQTKKFLLM